MCPAFIVVALFALAAVHSTTGFQATRYPTTTPTPTTPTPPPPPPVTTPSRPPPLHLNLLAVPDHPVIEGQSVVLHCQVQSGEVKSLIWMYYVRSNVTTPVGKGAELRLTRPNQSGRYRCDACSQDGQLAQSQEHTVMISSAQTSAVDDLGIAGFAFSVVAFILILGLLAWLIRQKVSTTATTTSRPSAPHTGHPDSSKAIERPPQADGEQDVYMNYTCSNEGYTDLDLSNVSEENVYSSFS